MRGVKYINFALLFFVMVSQAQRLRQQQKELRGEDLKGLSKTESLKLQQEALTKGVPKRRLLAIREQQARMRKAEASPEVKELKTLLTTQKTYLNNLKKQLADAETQRDAKRAEIENQPKPHRRSWRRRLTDESNILNSKANALRKVIPNVEKLVSQIDNFRKKAVTAVFVGRGDVAIEMAKSARAFASQVQSNSNNYVSAKVRERRRRIIYSRRRRKRRERRRDTIKDLRSAGVDIDLLKLGKVSITTEQAERLSPRTQKFLQLDKPMTWSVTTTPPQVLISGGIDVATGEKISHIDLFREDKRFIPNDIKSVPPPTPIQQFKNLFTTKNYSGNGISRLFDIDKQLQNDRQDALNMLKFGKATEPPTPTVKSIHQPDMRSNIQGMVFTGGKFVDDINIGNMIRGIPEAVIKAQKDLGLDSFVEGTREEDKALTLGDTIFLHTPVQDYGQGTWYKDKPNFDLTKVTLEDLTKMKKFELVAEIEQERFVKKSEKEAMNIINLAVLKLEKEELSTISDKLERKRDTLVKLVKAEIITAEIANKQLEKLANELEVKGQVNLKNKVDKIVERENKKFKDITTAEFKRIRIETNKGIDRRDALGVGVRSAIVTGIFGAALVPISIVAPPLAIGIGVGVGVSTFIGSGGITGITESYAEQPLTTTASIAGSIVGGVVVGGAVFGKTKISARKIHLALDRATNVPKSFGIKGRVNIEKIMAKFKITKEEAKGLLLDMEGNSNLKLSRITTELKAGKGMNELADAKILPKVRAEYLELLDEGSGTVVKRYTRGSVIAEQRGKIFSREVLERAVGMVEEGRVDFITRTLSGKPDIMKGWKSIEAINTLEKSKITGRLKRGRVEITTSETDTYMLGKTTSQARPVQKGLRKEMFDIIKTAEAGPENVLTSNILDIFIDTPGKIKKIGVGKDITATIRTTATKGSTPFGIKAVSKVVPDITKFIKIKGKAKFDLEVGSGTFKKFVKPKKIRDPDGGIKPPWDKHDIRLSRILGIRQFKDFGVKLEYFTEPSKLIPKPSKAVSKAIKKVNQKDVALDALTKPIKKLKQEDIPITSRSSYAGKGMYELTEGGIMPPSGTSRMGQVNVPKSFARLDVLTKDITKTIIKQDMTRVASPKDFIGFNTKFIGEQKFIGKQKSLLRIQQAENDLEKFLLGTTFEPIFKQPQMPQERIAPLSQVRLAQLQIQHQVPQLSQLTTTTTSHTPPILKIPPIPPLKVLPFRFPPFRKRFPQVKVDKRPYNVFIKGKKIGSNLSKPTAKNFGAYVVDNSIAAQFKIKPTRGKIKQPKFKVPPVFFDMNVNKFRSPRGKKSKRNIYIERKNRRLDTANEVNQITAARFVSSQRKLAGAGKVNIFGTI